MLMAWWLIVCALIGSPAQALAALHWWNVGKKVRARNLICVAAARSRFFYRFWCRFSEPRIARRFADDGSVPDLPPVLVLLLADRSTDRRQMRTSQASVQAAFGPAAMFVTNEARLADADVAQVDSLADLRGLLARGDAGWLLTLAAGDRMAGWSGQALAVAAKRHLDAQILYWDEDAQQGGRRARPWVKPEWDEWLHLACDMLSGASMIRAGSILGCLEDLPDRLVSGESIFDVLLVHLTRREGPDPIHVPLILSHRRVGGPIVPAPVRKRLIDARWPCKLDVAQSAAGNGRLAVRPPRPQQLPSISFIVPTRDKLSLLRTCLSGIDQTDYAGFREVIIVDNDSADADALAYLGEIERSGVTVLRYAGAFNFSAMNNIAAAEASGDLLCLLNNDVEMLDSGWLMEMIRFATLTGAGAVGAQLLYPDMSVQHAGVTVGVGGAAGHVHRGVPISALGDQLMPGMTRRVSAVTAACLLVSRAAFAAVGGFDAVNFPVAFNDVDFCLRLGAAGYRNFFVSGASLIHHEAKSRGSDSARENRDRFSKETEALQRIWHTERFSDPFHSQLLLRSTERCILQP
jgi:GT2 family glycosyltransferase